MASPPETLMETELLSLLKVENNGWNITLFNDAKKMSVCLCASCGLVCCDAVELDCDHKADEDIFLYCKQCLIHLIQQNENKCIINSHINPQIAAIKAIRRQISKSIVICPYSQQYKMRNIMQQNNNQQIMDTFGGNNININDEKEGNQPFKSNVNEKNENEKNENNCEWKGKLTDLNKHILKCATTNNPTFALNVKIKNLEHENIKLTNELNGRNQEILRNENVINDKIIKIRNENEDLRKELAAEKNKSVNMRLMYDEEKDKLLQEQKALNGVVDEERRKIDVLMNEFGAKEKAAIKTQNNLRNIQKKQANEIKKLKEIIKAKENEINRQILLIKNLLNENNKKEEEKKENEFDSKSILNGINIFKRNNHCIVDLKDNPKKGTYGILEIPWSKDTNGGIHEIKLKCLQSAKNVISIGMVTNSKAKTNKWLFDAKQCGLSYQLYVGGYTAIFHYKNGKQEYKEKVVKRKSYEVNETMSLRVDFNKLELSFFINSNRMGKTIKIKSNTYYPAVAYGVYNTYFKEYGVLQIKVLSLH